MSVFENTIRATIQSLLRSTDITPDAEIFLAQLIILAVIEPLVYKSILIMEHKGTKTCDSRELQTAIRAHFPKEISTHAVFEGTKDITRYQGRRFDQVARTKIFENAVKDMSTSLKTDMSFGRGFWIYFASVLEYIIAEVLKNSHKTSTGGAISVSDIRKGIKDDEELDRLFYPFSSKTVDELIVSAIKVDSGQYRDKKHKQTRRTSSKPRTRSKSRRKSRSKSIAKPKRWLNNWF